MSYEKPQVVAMNQPQGSYAAGCPEKTGSGMCSSSCEIRK
jgi:hypothetical protein